MIWQRTEKRSVPSSTLSCLLTAAHKASLTARGINFRRHAASTFVNESRKLLSRLTLALYYQALLMHLHQLQPASFRVWHPRVRQVCQTSELPLALVRYLLPACSPPPLQCRPLSRFHLKSFFRCDARPIRSSASCKFPYFPP